MFKVLSRVVILTTIVLALVACSDKSSTPAGPTAMGPEQTIQQSVKLSRENNVAGLIELMLPPDEFASLKAKWIEKREATPSDAAARARFATAMAKLTADNAADTLFKDLEPDIRQFDTQYQKQIPAFANMGRSYLSGIVKQSQELTEGEKQQALTLIEAVAKWVSDTHFTDPELVRKALVVLIDYARALDIKTLDEARAMSFDQAAPKISITFGAIKKILEVYGFSIDQTLDSVKTELVSNDGDNAVVKVSYTLLGKPVESTSEMIRIDGRWYSKDTIDKIKARNAESAAAAAAPTTSEG
jgi:hypothetical protein